MLRVARTAALLVTITACAPRVSLTAAPTAGPEASPTPSPAPGPVPRLAPPERPRFVTSDPDQALKLGRQYGRATMVVFFADWCAASHELETTFAVPEVKSLLDEGFVVARVDMTDDEIAPPGVSALHVEGLPTVVLFDADGREVDRFTEALDGRALMLRLRAVAGR